MELSTNIKPIVVIIHAFAGAIGIGATTVTDTLFFKFIADRSFSKGEQKTMETVSLLLWVAIITLLITGALLFFSNPAVYGASSKFILKMIIVGIIFFNGLLLTFYISPRLNLLQFSDSKERSSDMSFKRIAFFSGVLSISSWYGAFLLGLLASIPMTIGQGFLIYLGVLIIGGVISQIMLNRFSHKPSAQ